MTTPELRRGQRLPDAERTAVGEDLLRRYESGMSIREICRETGYSIGRVRRLLEDAGVTYRRRGGANHAARAARAESAAKREEAIAASPGETAAPADQEAAPEERVGPGGFSIDPAAPHRSADAG